MQNFVYHPEVKLLLVNHSDKKVNVIYSQNAQPFQLPKIGPRPPYYAYPSYEPFYPII